MPFDIVKAREDGMPDSQIAEFLAGKVGFDIEAAYKDGWTPTQVADTLTDELDKKEPAPVGDIKSLESAIPKTTVPPEIKPKSFSEMTKEEQIESETIEANPWVDPVGAFTSGLGSGLYFGKGAGIIAAGLKGITSGAVNAVMDTPLGVITDEVGKVNSKYSLPVSIGLGMLSGKIVETPLENKLLKAAGKLGIKAAGKLANLTKGIRSDVINDDYNKTVSKWIGTDDWQEVVSDVKMEAIRKSIKESVDEKQVNVLNKIFTGKVGDVSNSRKIDEAIQVYIDLKRNPDHLTKFFDDLSDYQKEIVNLSQSLTPKQIEIADQIENQYALMLKYAQDNDVNINSVDNYVNRVWKLKNKNISTTELYTKFKTSTKHAQQRTLDTILEGWAKKDAAGNPLLELTEPGATRSLNIYEQEISKAVNNKAFLQDLTALTDLNGNKLISTYEIPGYVPIEHPNFGVWRAISSQGGASELRGKNFYQSPDGIVYQKVPLYANPAVAKNLNNMLGVSKLKGHAFWDATSKGAALTKSWKLFTSFFHDMAFTNSYYLGGKPFQEAYGKVKSGEGFIDAVKDLSPLKAYKDGLQAVSNLEPEVELLVKNGLTLGRIQDWEEALLRNEDTAVRRFIHKNKLSGYVGDSIIALREAHTDFMFQQYGKGLKTKAALIELKSLLSKHPDLDPNEAAGMVARLINDDFGGLHLKRLGRNPTTQHMFRIFSLAPDWTESNLRTITGMFKAGQEGELYQRFWARAIGKAALGSLALNAVMTGGKGPELSKTYGKAWDKGKLRYLDVDVTPIYKAFGGDEPVRKYFQFAGHFKDPYLWAKRPAKSTLYYKSSIITQLLTDAITQEDWLGRQYTSVEELARTGSTVRPPYTFGVPRPGVTSIPSFILNKIEDAGLPIPAYNLLQWWKGELDGFDAVGKSIGLKLNQEPTVSARQKAEDKRIRKQIKAMYPKKRRRR